MGKHEGADINKEMHDPFIAETLPYVEFFSWRPGQEIADYLQAQFLDHGWTEQRGILFLEYTNCGGDWLKVFSQGDRQVLVHVCGPMEKNPKDTRESFASRTITYRFRGVTPAEVLGTNYRERQWSQSGRR
jgi:hypothetical protein